MPQITDAVARRIEKQLGVDLNADKITLTQFKKGIAEELEHVPTLYRIQKMNPKCKISQGDMKFISGSIAYDHLKEIPDYYTRLEKLEREAKQEAKREVI